MGKWVCKKVSILCLATSITFHAARADVVFEKTQVTHYTETSWLPQYDDVVVSSKLKMEMLRAGPVHGYGGALLEQDTRSHDEQIYNDNGVSPLVGAWMPLVIPELAVFTEYRQTFRMVNKPSARAGSQPDLLLGTYGYRYWPLLAMSPVTSLFQEAYGDVISRSKLSFNPTLESWSKTGVRFNLSRLSSGLSLDSFLDIEFRRASTGEPEDNYQTLGPGLRLNYSLARFYASISAHDELGSYTNRSDSIGRWKTLLVISGAL